MLALKKPLFDSGWRNIVRKVQAGTVLSLPGLPEGRSQATIPDISGNGNNGTITGATWARLPSGLWVLNFDGSDDKVTSSTTAFNFTTQAFSGEVWAKFNSLTVSPMLMCNTTNTEVVGWEFYASSSGTPIFGTCQTPAAQQYSYPAAGSIVTGTWYHLGFIRNGASARVYINGIDLTNTVGTHIDPTTSANALTLGLTATGAAQDLNGYVALGRIYNTNVAATLFANHYNQERHLFGV